MAHRCLALAAVFLASPANAGKLDLDLYGGPRPVFPGARGAQVPKGELWLPGDIRNSRGDSLAVQTISFGGSAGLGAAGFAQSIGAAGRNREAAAMSAGFGVITIINLWRTWGLWRDPGGAGKK